MQLPAAAILAAYRTVPRATLATLTPDGEARLVPTVFVHHADALWSPVDGKPKATPELARLRDITRDPRVTLLIDHYDADWQKLWWIRVRGEAFAERSVDPDGGVARALRAKYAQYATTPLFAGEPTLLRVRPLEVRSWAASAAAIHDIEGRGQSA